MQLFEAAPADFGLQQYFPAKGKGRLCFFSDLDNSLSLVLCSLLNVLLVFCLFFSNYRKIRTWGFLVELW